MQKQVIEVADSDSTIHKGDAGPESPIGQGTTIVSSIPVEPGDFQRVRLLLQYGLPLKSDAQEIDTGPPYDTPKDPRSGLSINVPGSHNWEAGQRGEATGTYTYNPSTLTPVRSYWGGEYMLRDRLVCQEGIFSVRSGPPR